MWHHALESRPQLFVARCKPARRYRDAMAKICGYVYPLGLPKLPNTLVYSILQASAP
jgi:hypothetical protein